jgi:heme-degrading monooxygenase HmoA
MNRAVIEMANIRLAEGKTEADLLDASARFQDEFLAAVPGFLSRELVRLDNGEYADIVRWESMEAAEAIMEKVASSAACQRYFSVMAANADDPADGVAHFRVLATYGSPLRTNTRRHSILSGLTAGAPVVVG